MKSNDKINFMQGGSIMVSEKKKLSNANWDKNNCKSYSIKLMFKTDNDIIEYLDKFDSKANEIRRILRLYMETQKKDQ